ncbi:bifunctional DNA primase/polymerase [Bradyrhizobium sp. RT10b]|uniref:bifunctional DNA primase/polymerase n=1 Tax=unclassified Bradyrhizobium TaxID=2631580 RepID=UPI00339276C9
MRDSSPFALTAPALLAGSFSPIPIMPNSKLPGRYADDSWRAYKGWNDFCTTRPSQLQIKYWSKWPDAGVGVACGLGLICIDIDFEPAMDALLAMLPHSNVQKKGRKGISLFYRGNTDVIRSRNFRTPERVGLVDLLSEGKQTVLPPSIHPDTGEPYYWWTDDTLLDVSLNELTELPDDIAERIGEVLKAYGYDPRSERRAPAQDDISAGMPGGPRSALSIYRQANDDALLNLDSWVPSLYLYKCRRKPGGYLAVATWRRSGSGRARELRKRNLHIVRDGIRDFGDGRTYTPVDLVMAALEIDKSTALNWMLRKLPQEPLILLRK